MCFPRCRPFTLLGLAALLVLSACNLQDAQATVVVIVPPSIQLVEDSPPTLEAAPLTLPEAQLAAQVTPQPAPALDTSPVPFDDQQDPVLLLASFYNAVNLQDYARAYSYWESPPNDATLQQFAQGYADTASVSGLVRLPIPIGAAAGSSYATLKTALISARTDGSQQIYTGCYVARKSNVPAGDSNWRLYDGRALAVAGPITLLLIDEACSGTSYEVPVPDVVDSQASPITLLESYYNAVNRRDYARAYGYWETPPRNASLEQFAQGYANTAHVDVLVGLGIQGGGAAGSVYTEIPALLIATHTDGSQQAYAGCFVTRRSNVPVGDAPTPDLNWRLYSASIAQASDVDAGIMRVAQGCSAS
jgi:hypothetical protein